MPFRYRPSYPGNVAHPYMRWFREETTQLSFLEKIGLGKERYVSLAFDVLPLLDASDSESVSIALGASITKNPNSFLKKLKKHRNNVRRLDVLLCNLGPRYADKFEEQTMLIRQRIDAINSVTEPTTKDVKGIVIDILEKKLEKLQRMREETTSGE